MLVVEREWAGMVSRENKIVVACILLAIPLGFGVGAVDALPDWSGYLVLFAVGVLLPGLLTDRY